MSEPKPLKILDKDSIKIAGDYYIYNEHDSTAIQVPTRIYNTIVKINELPNGINHVFVDVLATAINKRRLENVTEALELWTTSAHRTDYYPRCSANNSFQKLIRTFVKELCASKFTDNEISQLIYFFAKCPHGYDVTRLIKAHAELNPVIT